MGDKGLGAEMNAGKINPNVTQPQTTKANNRAKVVLSSVAGSAIGIAGAVAIYYLGEAVDYFYEKFKEWIFE